MSKIVYFGIPAHGHTNPTLPVVQALVARGHEVLYYNAESFRAKVIPTGVMFRAYPEPMPTEREVSEALHTLIDASLLITRASEALTPFAISEMEREQPDVILYDSTAFWGYVAARIIKVPHSCFYTHFVLDGSLSALGWGAIARYVASVIPHVPELARWKQGMVQHFGKENVGGITEPGDLNLVFTSEFFHPKNERLDSRFRFVGPSINAAVRTGAAMVDLSPAGTVVYISLGTVNHLDMTFYRAAFEALGDLDVQCVLSVGQHTNIDQLGIVPPNFIVRPSVNQLEVLGRADAFITHGGMNSVHEALVNGVPLVVVPHQMEQLLNGKRVAHTGAGILLGARYPYGRVTAPELRHALTQVLNDPSYRANAEKVGATLTAAGGYQHAVAEIEALLSTVAGTVLTAHKLRNTA